MPEGRDEFATGTSGVTSDASVSAIRPFLLPTP